MATLVRKVSALLLAFSGGLFLSSCRPVVATVKSFFSTVASATTSVSGGTASTVLSTTFDTLANQWPPWLRFVMTRFVLPVWKPLFDLAFLGYWLLPRGPLGLGGWEGASLHTMCTELVPRIDTHMWSQSEANEAACLEVIQRRFLGFFIIAAALAVIFIAGAVLYWGIHCYWFVRSQTQVLDLQQRIMDRLGELPRRLSPWRNKTLTAAAGTTATLVAAPPAAPPSYAAASRPPFPWAAGLPLAPRRRRCTPGKSPPSVRRSRHERTLGTPALPLSPLRAPAGGQSRPRPAQRSTTTAAVPEDATEAGGTPAADDCPVTPAVSPAPSGTEKAPEDAARVGAVA